MLPYSFHPPVAYHPPQKEIDLQNEAIGHDLNSKIKPFQKDDTKITVPEFSKEKNNTRSCSANLMYLNIQFIKYAASNKKIILML